MMERKELDRKLARMRWRGKRKKELARAICRDRASPLGDRVYAALWLERDVLVLGPKEFSTDEGVELELPEEPPDEILTRPGTGPQHRLRQTLSFKIRTLRRRAFEHPVRGLVLTKLSAVEDTAIRGWMERRLDEHLDQS